MKIARWEAFDLDEKETKPPSRYTDGSLIITMEKAGKFIEDEELGKNKNFGYRYFSHKSGDNLKTQRYRIYKYKFKNPGCHAYHKR